MFRVKSGIFVCRKLSEAIYINCSAAAVRSPLRSARRIVRVAPAARCRLGQVQVAARWSAAIDAQWRAQLRRVIAEHVAALVLAVRRLLREHDDVAGRVHHLLLRGAAHRVANLVVEVVEALAVLAVDVRVPVADEIF